MYCAQPHLQFIMLFFKKILLAFVHPIHYKWNCGLSFCCSSLLFCWMEFFPCCIFAFDNIKLHLFSFGKSNKWTMNALSVSGKIIHKWKWISHEIPSFGLMKTSQMCTNVFFSAKAFFGSPIKIHYLGCESIWKIISFDA